MKFKIPTNRRSQPVTEKKAKLEDTDASAFFETSNKIKRTPIPPKKPKKVKTEDDDFIVDDFDFDDDFLDEVETSQLGPSNGTRTENLEPSPKKPVTPKVEKKASNPEPVQKTPPKRKVKEIVSDDDDEFIDPKPHAKKSKPNSPKAEANAKPKTQKETPTKRKAKEPSSDKDDDFKPAAKEAPIKSPRGTKKPLESTTTTRSPVKPATKAATTKPPPAPRATKKQKEDVKEGDQERQAILNSIQTIEIPDAAAPSDTKYIPRERR
jgi:hypothetical protein